MHAVTVYLVYIIIGDGINSNGMNW
jgi:hypothetical protein